MKDKKQKNEQNAGAIAAKPKKKKKVLIVVLVIVAVLVVWIGISIHNATKQVAMAVNTVEVEPVQKRDLSDTISVKGTVAGASSTNVTSKAASEITSMNVQVGDIVKEGDVLCTLDSTSIEEKIADLEKSMSNANAVSSINTQQAADALQQAKEFNDVAEITGIVLTKMDGTAKGGIAVAIHAELGVPVKYIGVGETIDDLQKFNADDFVNALFERPKDDEASEEVSENE